jgi:hypothetical protein
LSFEDGDYVYLKVSPMRGLRHFKVRGKLAPWFICPLKSTEEREEELKVKNFQISFLTHPNLEDEIHFKGVGLSHPKISNFGM